MDAGIQPRKRNGCRQQKGQKTGLMVKKYSAEAAANELSACPDGNDHGSSERAAPSGRWVTNGRGRRTRFFEEHIAKQKTDAERDQYRCASAACVFGKEQQQSGSVIQTAP